MENGTIQVNVSYESPDYSSNSTNGTNGTNGGNGTNGTSGSNETEGCCDNPGLCERVNEVKTTCCSGMCVEGPCPIEDMLQNPLTCCTFDTSCEFFN